ncbi:MAG: hypothetical protein LLG09_05010 [Negativicutes bacterium]|nr:hypothetical protein [Negativicutes bacterium]
MKNLDFSRNLLQFGLDLGGTKQYGVLREIRRKQGACLRSFSTAFNLWEDSDCLPALCRQLDQLDPGRQATISLCCTGYPIRLKELPPMPYMKNSDLKRVAANEVEQYFGWTAEECLCDFAVYPTKEKQRKADKQIQLVVYALPKEPISALLLRLHASGRQLQTLDLRANTLYGCLVIPAKATVYQAILDFSCAAIEWSIFRDGILRRQHNLTAAVNRTDPQPVVFSQLLQDAAAFLNFYRSETKNILLSELYLLLPQDWEDQFAAITTELRQLLPDGNAVRVISLAALFRERFAQTKGLLCPEWNSAAIAAYGLLLKSSERGEVR